MNKLFLPGWFVLLLILSTDSMAQFQKQFMMYTGMSFSPCDGPTEKGRIYFDAEPSLKLSQQLSVGLRVQLRFATMNINYPYPINGIDMHRLPRSSIALATQYSPSVNNWRMFVGAGIGIYSIEKVYQKTVMHFGVFPRFGLEFDRVFVLAEYNYIEGSTDEASATKYTHSYWNFRAGIRVFGGPDKRERASF